MLSLRHKNTRGFTLIELLVVVAIIAMLASIVLASLSSARSKARDADRIAQMKQIATALELYYNDNTHYPLSTPTCNPGLNQYNDNWCRDSTDNSGATAIPNWIPGLQPYISAPRNPQPYAPGGWPFHYYSDGQRYWLMVLLENASNAMCTNGQTLLWLDNTSNACAWWGTNLYAIVVR